MQAKAPEWLTKEAVKASGKQTLLIDDDAVETDESEWKVPPILAFA